LKDHKRVCQESGISIHLRENNSQLGLHEAKRFSIEPRILGVSRIPELTPVLNRVYSRFRRHVETGCSERKAETIPKAKRSQLRGKKMMITVESVEQLTQQALESGEGIY
jgi:hypothetical protein